MTPLQHLSMLLRFDRTFNLSRVIPQVISSGDRVLDAGCGLGILSQWAAKAGAENIDAVDLSDLSLAKELAEANQLADKIDFHENNLLDFMTDESRKQSYDCLIAMIYLNDPRRDEPQTKLTLDLKKQLLKKGGKIIPDQVEYSICLADWPAEDWHSRKQVLHDQVNEISGRYGLNFEPLQAHLFNHTYKEYFPERTADGRLDLTHCRSLSGQQSAFTIDYETESVDYPQSISVSVDQPGNANVVIWWQKIIAQGHLIFTNQTIGWIRNPQQVTSGDQIQLSLDDAWRQHNLLEMQID